MARKRTRTFLIALFVVGGIIAGFILYRVLKPHRVRAPLSRINTVAGNSATRFDDPFGIVIASDQTVYVTDGEQGRLYKVAPDGTTIVVVADNLNTPSQVAVAPDGMLVVAETGAHVITRVDPQSGKTTAIAGVKDKSGFVDGSAAEARFNGPVGVAVGTDGTIYVADTYNDRIRAIDTTGRVRTLAGGAEPGFADAQTGANARFDTPCGIAVAPDGTLVVADTGNNRVRRVSAAGAVVTIAGTGDAIVKDGLAYEASFDEPTGITVEPDGTIYVADARGSAVRMFAFNLFPHVQTIIASNLGLVDGALSNARVTRPSGVALSSDGTVYIADTGNRVVRAVFGEGAERGSPVTHEMAQALRPTAKAIRAGGPPRWPYDPPGRTREIAATFGEVRGEVGEGKDAYFHNALDIPGVYGETLRAVRTERVLRPLSVEGAGTSRERIRFPTLGYIHLRVGRDRDDRAFNDERFVIRRDQNGRVTDVRVRRGARFAAGDWIGTINDQYHVHLIAGPVGAEVNALAALELPGIKDTVAPTIEKDGVTLFDRNWRKISGGDRAQVSGDVRIVVRAYDQMDGNAARRRLGPYRLGYEVLKADGSAAEGFNEPLMTISFERLPDDGGTARIAYAAGSKSGAKGETIFSYIVTNKVREGDATEDFWRASSLPAGDYTLRIFVEDFFGNRTTRDISVRVAN